MHPDPKRILPVILILAAIGIGYWLFTSQASAQGGALTASGTIESTEFVIAPELAGRVLTLKADEGDAVKAGDVLVELDAALLQSQRAQAAAALAAAAAQYDSLNDGPAAEQLLAAVARAEKDVLDAQQALDGLHDTADLAAAAAAADLARARDQLDKAEQRLRNINHPDLDLYEDRVDRAQDALITALENAELIDIGSLQAALQTARDFEDRLKERLDKVRDAIESCETCDPDGRYVIDRIPQTLDEAQDDYNGAVNRVRELELQIAQAKRHHETLTSDAQEALDDARQDLQWALAGPDALDVAIAQAERDLARARLQDAQRTFEAVQNGPDPDKLAAAEARLAAAQAALAAAQAAAGPERLVAAQAQLDLAQAALNALDTQIAKLTLTAPVDGTVLTRAVEQGAVALPGATLLTLADLSDLQITVYVPEDRYGVIRLGQPASVSVDSYAGETFTAQVTYIADAAEFTPRNVQTVDGRKSTVFAVRLAVQNPDGRLKPGMPADVNFSQ